MTKPENGPEKFMLDSANGPQKFILGRSNSFSVEKRPKKNRRLRRRNFVEPEKFMLDSENGPEKFMFSEIFSKQEGKKKYDA